MKRNRGMLDALDKRAQQPFTKMKFKILYLKNSQVVHEVEVKNVSYLDLKRHLQAGETVEIIPKSADHDVKHTNYHETPCYITHF